MLFEALGAVTGGLKAITGITDAINTITSRIADAKIAAINAKTQEERIASEERIRKLEAERDILVAQVKTTADMVEASLTQVNATMREEIKPENRHWFYTGWRPAAGWVFVIAAVAFGAILMFAGVASAFWERPEALKVLTDAWPIYAAYFATLAAMVGVYVVARSSDKARGVGTVAPPPKIPARR